MSAVEAISFDEVECGKKVAESKKRYKWRFNINGKSYHLELAVSTLSGKRIVTLNSVQIYSEQSILNIDFDYTHVIEGHTLRITRVPDFINKFEMRIDNQDFEDIKNNKFSVEKVVVQQKKYEYDPFADFGNVAKQANPQPNNNEFGDFDFDSFSAPAPPKTKSPAQVPPLPKQTSSDPFGFQVSQSKPPTASNYETVKFETNNFQTNVAGNFFNNFSKFDKQADEGDFATNTFGRNNLYNDLVFTKPEEKSDWNQFEVKPQEKEPGFFGDKFKIQMSAKQVLNKVKKTAQELKMKIGGQDESLI